MLGQQTVQVGTGSVEGRLTAPEIWVSVGYNATHPRTGELFRTIFKNMRNARWDKERGQWVLTGTPGNPGNPDKWFAEAGIQILINQTFHPGVSSLQELWTPMSMLSPNGRQVLIRHRLSGYIATEHALGWGAFWDKKERYFVLPVTDVYLNGRPRPNVHWDQASLDAAYLALTTTVAASGWEDLADMLSSAVKVDDDYMDQIFAAYGPLPDWWNRTPFPFQLPGAYAALLGHRLIADAPGLGKSLQAIAAAAICKAERILITCPPLLAVNWGREFKKCGYPGEITVFRAGRKAPPIPQSGVVIIPDSLLTGRTELREEVISWRPQFFTVDEAHRMKNPYTKRSQALLDVAAMVRGNGGVCVPLTGTPIISGPHELVPILEFSGLLGPIFGGSHAFLKRFCSRDPFGNFKPKMNSLHELNTLMKHHCWVRREKSLVLPWLPKRFLSAIELDVDTKPYREAHQEVLLCIDEWVDQFTSEYGYLPGDTDVEEFAGRSIGLISKLRVASAICKIPAAAEMIAEHLSSDPDNEFPLVVWVHHQELALALAEKLEELEASYGMLLGGMSDSARNKTVDDYQSGKLQVIIASLTAAGVGVTLTRGCDALFVETDWTPANVTQAVDRQHRIGQEKPVVARTLIAMNTLDEHVQKVQKHKQEIAGKITGDDQANVALLFSNDLVSPKEIVFELAEQVIKERRKLMLPAKSVA